MGVWAWKMLGFASISDFQQLCHLSSHTAYILASKALKVILKALKANEDEVNLGSTKRVRSCRPP